MEALAAFANGRNSQNPGMNDNISSDSFYTAPETTDSKDIPRSFAQVATKMNANHWRKANESGGRRNSILPHEANAVVESKPRVAMSAIKQNGRISKRSKNANVFRSQTATTKKPSALSCNQTPSRSPSYVFYGNRTIARNLNVRELVHEWRNTQVTQWKLESILCESKGKSFEIPEILWPNILQHSGKHISNENRIFTAVLVDPVSDTEPDTDREIRSPRQLSTRSTFDPK
ncbi:DNA repair protein RAD5 [Lasiodiplodia theobromae]|uniref:DNA repair protein RAD5 n=1 Tax=Lasiodiplodia theobromae TaxID=45133 RepID=UPI0015C2E9E1|nr:DNA repair protein RAD5 [Lasiodiplodia theobromae]KAF4534648.1 DNA repair protein RAD5 [Lasiodiplodia theobromae]